MSSNPAVDVQEYGQSLWLDYIHREELKNGELKRRITEEGILGVTSNPSIFQKAIGESDIYDQAMSQMLDLDAEVVYDRLSIEDIQAATDLFLEIYEETNGRDGYVSLEVSPLLADNTEDTVAEARRLFEAVDRPNLMIKIPGTEAGLPAIEEAIAAGINVNVTLLFDVDNYEQVAQAYLRGLERRLEAGQSVERIASVASFFLSRIDVAVDRILENNIRAAQVHADTGRIAANRKLLGQAAIANAKLAYRAYKRIFQGSRFEKLRAAGAMVQRPLWASTSTKDARYEDTRYVDYLIGRDTVNTLPPKTLAAFVDHGTADETLERNLEDFLPPDEVMDKLAELGVDFKSITRRLQVDGVDAFIDSFETLLEQVRAKLTVLRTGVMDRQLLALGIYAEDYNRALQRLEKAYFNGRIWNEDGGLWSDYNPTIRQIENRLGWLHVQDLIDLARLQTLQDDIRASAFETIVLLGMGGSSLAPAVLYETFGQQEGFPPLIVLDTTDPARIRQAEATFDVAKTLFIVASKSGSTIETMSLYRRYWQRTSQNARQFLAITDEGTELDQLAHEREFRHIFLNPPNTGGRYSALTYFGMVPAAVIGLDLSRLWESATRMIDASHENIPGQYHPGISLGTFLGILGQQGRDKLTIYSTQSLHAFGLWAEQLIAESLGKQDRGLVPIVHGKIGKPSDYSTDRLFVYLRVDGDPDIVEKDAAVRALREAGHPRATLRVPDPYAIAAEFFRWEFATAVAGYHMGLNPFDEPNVDEAKKITREMLDQYIETHQLPRLQPLSRTESAHLFSNEFTVGPLRELCRAHGYDPDSLVQMLAAQIAGTHVGDYFALLFYFTPSEEDEVLIDHISDKLRTVGKRAVTRGNGPRYLHSTGQLHKGGKDNGIFFIITSEAQVEDVEIPDVPYDFQTLFDAQAAGDMVALQRHDRRVLRLHLIGDPSEGLQLLLNAVKFVEERRLGVS